jgi:hypothetical protein
MCCYCVASQVCYAIIIIERKYFKELLIFFYNSYHLHTFEMTKMNKAMKERTPKTTNHSHTQERTKGSKIVVEKENNDEEHGGWGR